MAQNEQAENAAAAPKKGKSKVVMIMGVAMVAMAGVSGYLVMNSRNAHGSAPEEPKVVMSKQEQYLTMDPPFVVNFKDDQSMRFLQVGVSLMSHDAAALAAANSIASGMPSRLRQIVAIDARSSAVDLKPAFSALVLTTNSSTALYCMM